jgi:hypothetical protein
MSDALARAVTQFLGGEWHGRHGLAPGANHSKRDRSLSIKSHATDPNDVVLHSFAGDDVLRMKDDLRRADVLPSKDFQASYSPAKKAPAVVQLARSEHAKHHEKEDEAERRRRAIRLWQLSAPAQGTIVEAYLRRNVRGIVMPLPPTLRYLAANPPRYPYPKMIAAYGLTTEDEPGVLTVHKDLIAAVHCTELSADGSGKAPAVNPVRWTLGPANGWPIQLAVINDSLGFGIGEGIESGLSIAQRTGLGVWAAGSAPFMPALAETVPHYVECVSVFGETDGSGKTNATKLINGLLARHFEVRLCEV